MSAHEVGESIIIQQIEDDKPDLRDLSAVRPSRSTVSKDDTNYGTQNAESAASNSDNNGASDQQTTENNTNTNSNGSNSNKTQTRFKWTKEKSQVAMNLVRYGCKPKLVSVAVGCSLRTAQKFVETVTPKRGESGTFKTHEIRRRGRKSKDVNQRLDAIREVLSRDSTKTQVEIAADLKVSNTTVCRDLKKIGASWREKNNVTGQAESRRKPRKDRHPGNEKDKLS